MEQDNGVAELGCCNLGPELCVAIFRVNYRLRLAAAPPFLSPHSRRHRRNRPMKSACIGTNCTVLAVFLMSVVVTVLSDTV